MRIKNISFGLALACILLISCDKKSIYKGAEPDNNQPNDFSFSTKQQTDVNIHYDVPTGYRVHFEAYYSNPLSLDEEKNYVKDTTLRPFLTGYTDGSGKFSLPIDMPSYIENVYVYSDYAGVPALLAGKVQGSSVTISEAAQVPSKAATKSKIYKYKNWNKFSYTLQQPELKKANMTISDKLFEAINLTLPTESSLVNTYHYECITLQEDAEITLYFVSNGLSERQNALAYYVMPEGVSYDQNTINSNLTLAFADLKTTSPGEGVKLVNTNGSEKFTKGTTIAFALLIDAYRTDGLISPSHIIYSENKFNKYTVIYGQGASNTSDRGNVPHMGAFKTPDEHVILAFEDQPYHESLTDNGDFRDEVFILEANPLSSLPDEIKPGVDPDVEEPEYTGTTSSAGILCFEDNWPKKGDYDLNDVMVSYERTLYWNEDFMVVSTDETYTFLNNGAVYNNAFGYQVGANVKTDNIKSVKISSAYTCEGQSQDTDPKLEKATIMLFDNGTKVPEGTTFKVHTVFKSPVYFTLFNFDPYNPFIVVTNFSPDGYLNHDRTEVHLPKFAPTAKANPALFGTEDDKSNGNNYYVRAGNYPFALDISLGLNSSILPSFGVPEETQPIDVTYPRFTNWVKSGGTTDKDWYIK